MNPQDVIEKLKKATKESGASPNELTDAVIGLYRTRDREGMANLFEEYLRWMEITSQGEPTNHSPKLNVNSHPTIKAREGLDLICSWADKQAECHDPVRAIHLARLQPSIGPIRQFYRDVTGYELK